MSDEDKPNVILSNNMSDYGIVDNLNLLWTRPNNHRPAIIRLAEELNRQYPSVKFSPASNMFVVDETGKKQKLKLSRMGPPIPEDKQESDVLETKSEQNHSRKPRGHVPPEGLDPQPSQATVYKDETPPMEDAPCLHPSAHRAPIDVPSSDDFRPLAPQARLPDIHEVVKFNLNQFDVVNPYYILTLNTKTNEKYTFSIDYWILTIMAEHFVKNSYSRVKLEGFIKSDEHNYIVSSRNTTIEQMENVIEELEEKLTEKDREIDKLKIENEDIESSVEIIHDLKCTINRRDVITEDLIKMLKEEINRNNHNRNIIETQTSIIATKTQEYLKLDEEVNWLKMQQMNRVK